MRTQRSALGSARYARAGCGAPLQLACPAKVCDGEVAIGHTRVTRAFRILALAFLGLTIAFSAATLQERIDAALPNESILVEPGVYAGSLTINKPLQLIGQPGAEIRGDGKGKVVTIAADNVTLSGLRIAGSGLQLMDDDAAVFVTGNRARIENNVIVD